jgi:hypothetical protein
MTKRALVIVIVPVMAAAVGLGACRSSSTGSVAGFCAQVQADRAKFGRLTGQRGSLRDAAAAVHDLQAKAPSAVKDDLDVISHGFDDLFSGNPASALSDAANLKSASEHLVGYVKDNCQINLGDN